MHLPVHLEVIRYLAFAEGVLEQLLAQRSFPEASEMAVSEARRRVQRALEIIQAEPVTYPSVLPNPPTGPSPFDLDPCAGCGPVCGNSACPKRLQVTCGVTPQTF
jgi:hypothetical protein